jgi:serine/threonine-protein kinase
MDGKTVSHYTIIEELGRGGMGVVYRAEDQKLRRTVALKFLPPNAVADATERERFAREAQAAAALNHPNIATVFEIDDHAEHPFIAMEFVEGKSLKDILAAGQLKAGRAVDLAIQIAEGLHAAHAKGVVHRDMKTANVMVAEGDRVKIMDFGLAKLKGASLLTKQGTTLGTVAYMSPEQARGESVDHRTDIWSFGVVFYEMLTGRHPFPGEFEQAVIYNILNGEPEPLSALRSGLPMELERIVSKCLSKEPSDRYQNIQEVPVDLRAVRAGLKSSGSDLSRVVGASRAMTAAAAAAQPGTSGSGSRSGAFPAAASGVSDVGPVTDRGSSSGGRPGSLGRLGRLGWFVAAILALVTVAITFLLTRPAPAPPPIHLEVSLPPTEALNINNATGIAISRDGTKIVYRTVNKLYLRRLDRSELVAIQGTDRASNPFFSPDGRWVGFFADGKLRKVPVEGGVPIDVAEAIDNRGAAWGDDGRIIFCPGVSVGLMSVAETGGEVTALTDVDSVHERTHRWPSILPGGKVVLFTIGSVASPDYYEEASIGALNIVTKERKIVVRGASSAQYISSGHVLYSRSGMLHAAPFDQDKMEVTGPPVPVIPNVTGDPTTGAMNFGVSDNGTLVYVPGQIEINDRKLVRIDLSGKIVPYDVPMQSYIEPKISPDGTRIAVTIGVGKDFDIWIFDIRRTTLSRLTFGGLNRSPAWSPDGKRVAFFSYGGTPGTNHIMAKPADGSGEPETLYTSSLRSYLNSWSRDGKYLCVDRQTPKKSSDLCVLPLDGQKKIREVLSTPYDEYESCLSPDGNWLAYISNESGAYQAYVRKFPEGGKWQVSTDEGSEPRWSPDGKTLYYFSAGRFMAVEVSAKEGFTIGTPRVLFSGFRLLPIDSGLSYDMSPDGTFLVTSQPSTFQESLTTIDVVLNFFTDVRDKSVGSK